MSVFDVLRLVMGVSLFLFGMGIMSDSLKYNLGDEMKKFLSSAARSKTRGVLLGGGTTMLVQSSSAVTVMVVGFVNSGVMLLSQATYVIMGANVGTAVTSWLTALSGIEGGAGVNSLLIWFKPSVFTPVLAFIGIIFYMSSKTEKKRGIGIVLLGFSVLMIGMETMADAVSVLRTNEKFHSILLAFENPILGVLAGMVLTAIVQSSSASIGILQSLTATGAITFGSAIPIIMGQNIGTCITAILASLGGSKNAKRASVIHLAFNVFGSLVGLFVLFVLKYILKAAFLYGTIDMWGIAATHTVFNLLSFIILFPLARFLERLSFVFVPEKENGK